MTCRAVDESRRKLQNACLLEMAIAPTRKSSVKKGAFRHGNVLLQRQDQGRVEKKSPKPMSWVGTRSRCRGGHNKSKLCAVKQKRPRNKIESRVTAAKLKRVSKL